MTTKKIAVIAGGGTGGHIYPGLAIAKAIMELEPGMEVHFVGSPQGLETKIVPREGFPLHLIHVGKLNYTGGIFGKIKTLILLPYAILQCASLLWSLKPEVVLGVGGYASGPFVLVAALLGFKTAIWEPNAMPGMTNRWLSRFVDRCYVVFESAKGYLKTKRVDAVGLPVRDAVEKVQGQSTQSNEFRILVFGGSQGARAINNAMKAAVEKGGDWLKDLHLIHQTGSLDFADILKSYSQSKLHVEAHEYLHNMPEMYTWADLIICRAGASTVAEISAVGKPAIFIPLPSAADDHQRKNAEVLVSVGAGKMILQKDLTPDSLIQTIQELRSSESVRKEMAKKALDFYTPKAAHKTAESLLSL
ncbi:MAG: undecaprenyldiphospho-muramoylpentapeptide beta-N-acetylglucosaminyltransferase [Pseudobdellovibrionaceae bacterium]